MNVDSDFATTRVRGCDDGLDRRGMPSSQASTAPDSIENILGAGVFDRSASTSSRSTNQPASANAIAQ